MTRNMIFGGFFVLVFTGTTLAADTIQAPGKDAPPAAKSSAASDSSANGGMGTSLVGGLLSHLVTQRAAASTAPGTKELPRSEGPARIWLRVPRDAQVWFNGQATTLTGRHRRFLSPTLLPGKSYSYTIRVRWMKDGKAVEEERNIEFRAGESVPIDFTRPDDRVLANTTKPKVALTGGTAK